MWGDLHVYKFVLRKFRLWKFVFEGNLDIYFSTLTFSWSIIIFSYFVLCFCKLFEKHSWKIQQFLLNFFGISLTRVLSQLCPTSFLVLHYLYCSVSSCGLSYQLCLVWLLYHCFISCLDFGLIISWYQLCSDAWSSESSATASTTVEVIFHGNQHQFSPHTIKYICSDFSYQLIVSAM